MDAHTRAADARQERRDAARLDVVSTPATAAGKRTWSSCPTRIGSTLFSNILQQLVMESLGKENDLDGNVVHQGIAVYGNKGSTDQHAYVQQLRDGVPNFFATFIEVLKDRASGALRSRAGRDERRLSAGISARHPRGALRKRARIDHAHAFRRSTHFTSAR